MMRVNLVDTLLSQLWNWVSGRSTTLDREEIGMEKLIVVVEEGVVVEEVEEEEEGEEGDEVIDESTKLTQRQVDRKGEYNRIIMSSALHYLI